MAKACAGTSSVGPSTPSGTLVWIGVQTLATAVLAALTAPFPWIGAVIASKLVNVDNLCATPPDVPDAWINGDILGTIGDFVNAAPPSAGFMVKLWQYIEYQAFQRYCQCTISTSCTTQTYALDWNTNLLYTGSGLEFVWPASCHGTSTTCTRQYQPWNAGCNDVNITIWQGAVGSPGQPQLVTHIFDCQGQLYSQSHIMGTPIHVVLRAGCTGFSIPGFNVTWDWNINPATVPQWTVVVSPTSGQTGTGTTPVDVPPPVITVPAPPTQPCDSTTLCDIQWFITRNITNVFQDTNITNNQITDITVGTTNLAVPKYVLGSAHSVTGIGELSVSGVVGVLVVPTGFVAGIGVDVSDPNAYFDAGYVTFGNADGWQANQRVIHNGEVFLTQLQDVTRIGYNCDMSTGFTITELVAPP